jgi:predicted alpha-1,6-mannanase (GH76 family)
MHPNLRRMKLRTSHLFWQLACGVLLLLNFSAAAFTAKDVEAVSGAYTSAFYSLNGTNGFIKDTQTGGVAYFWGQAEMIETVIDAYEWNSNSIYAGMTTNLLNGFLKNNGSSWTYNIYNDDIMWAVLAFARGGVATGRSNYCAIAKANFDTCYARAWDSTLGGGLWWTTDKNGKNACVNGPGAIAAALLYQIYGDTNYWNKATNMYYWERAVLYNTNTGAIYDSIGTNGVINYWSSTYNQGTFLGAANFLGQTNDATLAAKFTMMNMTSGGILPEYGIAGNNSGFNAIYLRWFTRFMKQRNLQNLYQPWLQTNAVAAWNNRRADNLSWCQWQQASPSLTNFYSWDCIASFSALSAADPTQGSAALAVPVNAIGYWPLDATNVGFTVDASGNGNSGSVTNVALSNSGRVNGCLVFNGASSSVSVTNPLGNDFSLAFWVKTTQSIGSGQWYNGVGLVDADAPLNNNDFGTGLVGGKFAFGVGNPDTTIASTTVISDGNWHHCVATLANVAGTSFTDVTALVNRTYYYVVSPVNAVGEGPNSAPASASALPLAAWFKADALTNLANGSAISQWPDVSGNGFSALQTVSANQPMFVASAINGQPAVRFNAANSSHLWFYRPVADDFTMIFVFQSSQGLSTGQNFWEGAGLINGEQGGTVNDFGLSLNANGQILAGTGNPDVTIRSSTGWNNGAPHVVTFKRIKSSGTLVLYVDGGLVASGGSGTQSLNAPNFLVLGGQGVLNNFLTGDLGEVQIYSAALADADRLGVERALKCKYSLSGGATPTSPTSLTGTAGNRVIALNWLLSPGATGYNLWRSTNAGATYQLAATNLVSSSFVDTNATSGVTNLYKVATNDACGAGVNSAALAVNLPLPALGLSASANALTLSWPTWASDWSLYAATNLTPPVIWLPVTNAVSSNSQFQVSLPFNAPLRFFRLVAP